MQLAFAVPAPMGLCKLSISIAFRSAKLAEECCFFGVNGDVNKHAFSLNYEDPGSPELSFRQRLPEQTAELAVRLRHYGLLVDRDRGVLCRGKPFPLKPSVTCKAV